MPKKKLTIEDAAQQWLELKAKERQIAKRLEELKACLEPYLSELPDRSTELSGHKFTLVIQEREYFQLSKAKEKLDGRVLSPYISKKEVQFIKTTCQGDELAR